MILMQQGSQERVTIALLLILIPKNLFLEKNSKNETQILFQAMMP